MIGMKVKTIDQTRRVRKAVDRASYRNLGHAAASLRSAAMKSIKRGKGPGQPGKPPHTRGKRKLPRSIYYDADREGLSSIVGPKHSLVGLSAEAQEFGKTYKGTKFPERPFMGPALDANADRMPSYWLHSVGE